MQRLKQAKFTDEQAEFLAKETEEIISNIIEQAEQKIRSEFDKRYLATRADLHREINKLLYVYGAGFIALLGILAKGFGWF
ncbi:MAG: hypothetical protein ACK5Z5_03125 [Neisseriaceae bacterium]